MKRLKAYLSSQQFRLKPFGMRHVAAAVMGVLGCGVLAYTNCSGTLPRSPLAVPPAVGHEDVEKLISPQQSPLLGDRNYVAEIFRSVFIEFSSSADYAKAAEELVREWIVKQANQFGRACNLYEGNSGTDCGGDPGSSSLPLIVDDTVGREAMRLRVCEEVLAYEEAVGLVIGKLEYARSVEKIDKTALREMAELFYRIREPDEALIEALYALNAQLVVRGESLINRWRMAILLTCESPDWQLL